ncbi:MAG TPA: type VI secretion system contractile sheath small subunit [Myxococcales bacterium]|jgi:type VI secretion system protein ImpB
MAIQDDLPRSRITLTYRTTISGQPEDVDLPFRLLVMGDLSQGTSPDRQLDLDARRPRSLDGKNLNDVMKDMKMTLSVSVPNKINESVSPDLPVNLQIEDMNSFHPDNIAQQVPQLKALFLLRTLILEMQSSVDNRKELRKQLYELFSKPDELKDVLDKLKSYETLKLPPAPPKPAGSGSSASATT